MTAATILIVDDSKTERHVLSEMLQKNGYVVFTAENGTEALSKADADMYDEKRRYYAELNKQR